MFSTILTQPDERARGCCVDRVLRSLNSLRASGFRYRVNPCTAKFLRLASCAIALNFCVWWYQLAELSGRHSFNSLNTLLAWLPIMAAVVSTPPISAPPTPAVTTSWPVR